MQQTFKLDYRKTLLIGFGFLASSLAWSIYNSFVPLILEERFMQSSTLIGMIMTIDNFFGVIFQPLVGTLSDRTKGPLGKRIPWILLGLPICAGLFIFIPRMTSLWLTMGVIIAFNFVMSLWRSPVISLMPDMTPESLRSSANGVINLMGGIGSVIAFLVGGKLAAMSGGFNLPFLMGGIVMILALALLMGFVCEPAGLRYRRAQGRMLNPRELGLLEKYDREVPEVENVEGENGDAATTTGAKKRLHNFFALPGAEKKSLFALLLAIFFWFSGYNAVETFFTLFATKNLGVSAGQASMMLTAYSISFLIFAVPSGLLAQKIGRKRLITIGLIGLVFSFTPLLFIQSRPIVYVLLFIGGLFWACININSLPLVLGFAKTESIGTFTGYYYFFSFSAAIASPILFGRIRDLTGTYSTLFVYSIAAFILSLICVLMVKQGSEKKA